MYKYFKFNYLKSIKKMVKEQYNITEAPKLTKTLLYLAKKHHSHFFRLQHFSHQVFSPTKPQHRYFMTVDVMLIAQYHPCSGFIQKRIKRRI